MASLIRTAISAAISARAHFNTHPFLKKRVDVCEYSLTLSPFFQFDFRDYSELSIKEQIIKKFIL